MSIYYMVKLFNEPLGGKKKKKNSWSRHCSWAELQSIYYNQMVKCKYNGDTTKLFHNNITVNNMILTKPPYFDVVEHVMEY